MREWASVVAACAHDPTTRVPLFWADPLGASGDIELGSVARAHVAALERWPRWIRSSAGRVTLCAAHATCGPALAEMNARLREEGLILGWRDEPFPLYTVGGEALGITLERAATRFWGSLTLGAHCNGFVADARGRPEQLWIARRSTTKASDPGMLDNLIGGGVAMGQTPREALLREAWEEAGLREEQLSALRPGRVVRVLRDTREGLHRERMHVFDLALRAGSIPANQDGEVAHFALHALPEALALAAGHQMTVDASLATLDFALRHGLLPAAQHAALSLATAGMFVDAAP